MRLGELGFNNWLNKIIDPIKMDSFEIARVIAVDKESFVICSKNYEGRAELTGKLMYSAKTHLDYPTVGDWVYSQCFDENSVAIIHEVLPRKSILYRKVAGKKVEYQLIAANVDIAFLIQSLDANFNLRRLERYMAITLESRISPVVLLSKSDLMSPDEIQEKISDIRQHFPDVPVVSFSNLTTSGADAVRTLLTKGETFCLLGSSGVGKTTLLNNLIGEERYDTKTVRASDSKGRHSTTRRQLSLLDCGAIIIDTPGMRELGVVSAGIGINETFNEISKLSLNCQFLDCSHIHEKGCAILDAVAKGLIPEKRYQNYIKMTRESKYHTKTYLEKRRDDKAFGKMIKAVKKNIHKK